MTGIAARTIPLKACLMIGSYSVTHRSGRLQVRCAILHHPVSPVNRIIHRRPMCGRYALYGPRSRSKAEADYFASLEQFPGSWNVAPGQTLPITRLTRQGLLEQVTARWGLVPYWSNDEKIGFKCINARAETIATAPAFRGP